MPSYVRDTPLTEASYVSGPQQQRQQACQLFCIFSPKFDISCYLKPLQMKSHKRKNIFLRFIHFLLILIEKQEKISDYISWDPNSN